MSDSQGYSIWQINIYNIILLSLYNFVLIMQDSVTIGPPLIDTETLEAHRIKRTSMLKQRCLEKWLPPAIAEKISAAGYFLHASRFIERLDAALLNFTSVQWGERVPSLTSDQRFFLGDFRAIEIQRNAMADSVNLQTQLNRTRSQRKVFAILLWLGIATLVADRFLAPSTDRGDVPAESGGLTDEQIEILREQRKLFLQHNQAWDRTVAE